MNRSRFRFYEPETKANCAYVCATPRSKTLSVAIASVYTMIYVAMVRFEWDEAKNETNKRKHGIDFEAARLVINDPYCLTFVERVTRSEERWHAIGSIENILLIVVVHTYREDNADEVVRIISARRATLHERKLYAQAIGEKA